MQYEKQNFKSGQKLLASHLNHIEDSIDNISTEVNKSTQEANKNTETVTSLSKDVSQLKRDIARLKEDQTIETVLPIDAVCIGSYRQGILDPTYKHNIATTSYVKPFVVSAKVNSADYQLSVVVYKNGVYFKTEG